MSIARDLTTPPSLDAFGESSSPAKAVSPETLLRSMAMEEGLLDAESSETLLRAVLDFLATSFNAAGFFLVQGALIVGREAVGDPVLSRLVMPARSATIFGRVTQSRRPFFGPIPAHLQDAYIHQKTNRPIPAEVLCVPVVIEGTCVGLVYADRLEAGAPIDPSLPHRLGRMVASAFLDLFSRDLEATLANSRTDEDEFDEDDDEGEGEGDGDQAQRLEGAGDHDEGAEPARRSSRGSGEKSEASRLVESLAQARHAPEAEIEAVIKLGEAAVDSLIELFPGRIDETAAADPDRTRHGEGHSALVDAVAQMGQHGVTVALAALSDSSPLRRRYGALLFRRLPIDRAVPALLSMMADPASEVADAAVLALESTRDGPFAGIVTERVIATLGPLSGAEPRMRRRIIRLAGALGSVSTIEAMRAALEHPQLSDSADQALQRICFASPRGRNRPRAWARWLEAHPDRDSLARKRFAVEALEDSGEAERLAAITWLRRVTRHYFSYAHDASARERSAVAAQWRGALSL